jgi:hypothetical protein
VGRVAELDSLESNAPNQDGQMANVAPSAAVKDEEEV